MLNEDETKQVFASASTLHHLSSLVAQRDIAILHRQKVGLTEDGRKVRAIPDEF
jgi:hypothetical protein